MYYTCGGCRRLLLKIRPQCKQHSLQLECALGCEARLPATKGGVLVEAAHTEVVDTVVDTVRNHTVARSIVAKQIFLRSAFMNSNY